MACLILGFASIPFTFGAALLTYDYGWTDAATLAFIAGIVEGAIAFRFASRPSSQLMRIYQKIGNRFRPTAEVVVITLLCLVANLGTVIGAHYAVIQWRLRGTRLQLNPRCEIYYRNDATEADARHLVQTLTLKGILDRQTDATIILSKGAGRTTVFFVVNDGVWNTPASIANFESLGRHLTNSGFARSLTICLLSRSYQLKRTLSIN